MTRRKKPNKPKQGSGGQHTGGNQGTPSNGKFSERAWWVILSFVVTSLLAYFAIILPINRSEAHANETVTALAKTEPAARQETATSKAEATAKATATQGAIQLTETQSVEITESMVNLAAYTFCSRLLDLDGENLPLDLSDKLKGLNLTFGKIYKTPYWNAMHETAGREYMFLALANRGEVFIDPQETTNIIWEPAQEQPEGWLSASTMQRDGRVEAHIANVLLIADRPATLSSSAPEGPANPPVIIDDPSLSDSPALPGGFTLPQDTAPTPLFECDYPNNWDVEKMQFTLSFKPKALDARPQDFILSAADPDSSIPPLFANPQDR